MWNKLHHLDTLFTPPLIKIITSSGIVDIPKFINIPKAGAGLDLRY